MQVLIGEEFVHPSNLSRPSLFRNEILQRALSKYWKDFLKMNSCDLGVLTALGYDPVNMQLNLHFNVTVAVLSFNVTVHLLLESCLHHH